VLYLSETDKGTKIFLNSVIRRGLNFCYKSVTDLSVSEVSDVRGWGFSWCCKLNEKLCCTCQKRKKRDEDIFEFRYTQGFKFLL